MGKNPTKSRFIGSKKIIFIIRHVNDLDFMLPLMLYACNPIVLIWGSVGDADFRLKLLRQHGIQPVKLDGVNKSLSDRIQIKMFRLLRPLLGSGGLHRLQKTGEAAGLKSLAEHLKIIKPNDVDTIVFDHTINDYVKNMIEVLRAWKPGLKLLSLPHGQGIVKNKMTKYGLIKPNIGHDWNVFDKMLFFNESQSEQYPIHDSKKIVLPSLRSTREWIQLIEKEIGPHSEQEYSSYSDSQRKIKVLIIHTRLSSNINAEEVVRMIRIMEQFGGFEIRIKPHPRRMANALAFARQYSQVSVMLDHVISAIRWSDCVIFFQSSAVFDAFLLDKPVIYPRYASSNQLNEEVLEHCNVLDTPDDFYYLAKSMAEGNSIKLPEYQAPSWDELINHWSRFLNKE